MAEQASTSATAPPGSGHVFLSYAREDEKAAAKVVALLEKQGHKVWWDRLLSGGERYAPVIGEALDSARAVVVLWSKPAIASHWVLDEAGRGRDRGCLVPLSIDGTQPPLGFGQINAIDVSKEGLREDGPASQRMLAAVALLCDGTAPALPTARPGRSVSRRRLMTGGAAAVVAGGIAAWKFWPGGAFRPENSLAVLPFDNLSGDPAQQYLSDGIAAELRSRFARNPLLKVAGQTSSNQFRGQKAAFDAIAQKLGVASLLSGSVRVGGGEVRIDVQLADGRDDAIRWSESYTRPLDNILKLQEEIAEAVDAALTPRLAAGNHKEPVKRSGTTSNAAAFDAYLKGKDLFEAQSDEASDRAALARFDNAIALDGKFAGARAMRSRSLVVIGNQYVQSDERRRLFAEAAAEARRATDLASEYPDGYAALAYAIYYGELDIAKASQPYEKALLLGSGSVGILSGYALFKARWRKPDKVLLSIEKAIALDPINPLVLKTKAQTLYALGQWDEAIATGRKTLELNPKRSTVHGLIGDCLLAQGKPDEAWAEYQLESYSPTASPGKAAIAMQRGDKAGAEKILSAFIAETGDNSLYQQAQILAQWGRKDEALTALETAKRLGDPGLVMAYTDFFLKPLEGEARFNSLLQAMHFV